MHRAGPTITAATRTDVDRPPPASMRQHVLLAEPCWQLVPNSGPNVASQRHFLLTVRARRLRAHRHVYAPRMWPLQADMPAATVLKDRSSRVLALLFYTLGLTTLSACSTFQREVAEFQAGWRVATVTAVGNATAIKSKALSDCREGASSEQRAACKRAVRVAFVSSRRCQTAFTHHHSGR